MITYLSEKIFISLSRFMVCSTWMGRQYNHAEYIDVGFMKNDKLCEYKGIITIIEEL